MGGCYQGNYMHHESQEVTSSEVTSSGSYMQLSQEVTSSGSYMQLKVFISSGRRYLTSES